MSERAEIIIGGIYRYCGEQEHQYEVIAVPNSTTCYEEEGFGSETVIYRQLYDGDFPVGTVWPREAWDFQRSISINGRKVKKFKLIREPSGLALPDFYPGCVVKETANYRVVTDWKPGLENQPDGERFFIEPKTDAGEEMLFSAAQAHNIPNFNPRTVLDSKRLCLRCDFSMENLGPIFFRETIVPEVGKDSVPSPDRMEECLEQGHKEYSFEDWVLPVSPQFKMTTASDKSLLL